MAGFSEYGGSPMSDSNESSRSVVGATRRKGIILAGGAGTRLHPLTLAVSKQLMPVYDKPMVYYAISTLMLAGIDEMLIITTGHDQPLFKNLLGDGSRWGVQFEYVVQDSPDGIAQAFLLGEGFIGDAPVALILGDNLFYGHGLEQSLKSASQRASGATIFSYWVRDPQRYGIVDFDAQGEVAAIIEKPADPPSNYAVTGLYFYDNRVVEMAKTLSPSPRGELEITDLNNLYLADGQLGVETLGRGMAWLDTGTHESLLAAANFIQVVEARQGLKVMAPEEVAWHMGLIDDVQLRELAQSLIKSGYGEYLLGILARRRRGQL